MHASDFTKDADCESTFTLTRALGGMFVVGEYEQRIDGKVSMLGHAVIGYDADKDRYTLHWFDNMGNPPSSPGYGTWQDSTLVFEHESPKHKGRTIFEITPEGFRFSVAMQPPGKDWQTALEGDYSRDSAHHVPERVKPSGAIRER